MKEWITRKSNHMRVCCDATLVLLENNHVYGHHIASRAILTNHRQHKDCKKWIIIPHAPSSSPSPSSTHMNLPRSLRLIFFPPEVNKVTSGIFLLSSHEKWCSEWWWRLTLSFSSPSYSPFFTLGIKHEQQTHILHNNNKIWKGQDVKKEESIIIFSHQHEIWWDRKESFFIISRLLSSPDSEHSVSHPHPQKERGIFPLSIQLLLISKYCILHTPFCSYLLIFLHIFSPHPHLVTLPSDQTWPELSSTVCPYLKGWVSPPVK